MIMILDMYLRKVLELLSGLELLHSCSVYTVWYVDMIQCMEWGQYY